MKIMENNDEILKNNILIAEFMGVKPKYGWFDGFELKQAGLPFSYGFSGNGTKEPKFNESWDWLMCVIEKINFNTEDALNEYYHNARIQLENGYKFDSTGNLINNGIIENKVLQNKIDFALPLIKKLDK